LSGVLSRVHRERGWLARPGRRGRAHTRGATLSRRWRQRLQRQRLSTWRAIVRGQGRRQGADEDDREEGGREEGGREEDFSKEDFREDGVRRQGWCEERDGEEGQREEVRREEAGRRKECRRSE